MAIQVLNDPLRSLYGSLGAGAGQGISSGLSYLAEQKLGQIQKQQQATEAARGLKQIFPQLTNEQAYNLALAPQGALNEYTKSELRRPGEEAYADAIKKLLGGGEGNQPPQIGQDIQRGQVPSIPEAPFTAEGLPNPRANLPANQQEQLKQREAAGLKIPGRLTGKQATDLAKIQQGQKKEARAERAESRAEKEFAYKLTKPEMKEIHDKAQIAKNDLHELEEMEELEKTGKLDTPGYTEFLKRSGLDIPALLNPESEEFQKIQQNFLRNAKSYFGGKVSDFEVGQFLKAIPSLSQSPEGRKRVIADLKYFARAALERENALSEILKENNNIPPLNLTEEINTRVEKKIDAITKKFKEDLKKEVPAGQNRLITALQAGLGTAAGRIPRAAAGAGTGAYLGSKFGPGGVIPGALLGGLAGLGGFSLKDIL